MFCCVPLCCKPKLNKIDTSTSPINNNYSKLENSFDEIIENLDNNLLTKGKCINCNQNEYENIILKKDEEINNLFNQYNILQIEYDNLYKNINEQKDYINNLESTLNKEINNIIKDKHCYLNTSCNHNDCNISYYIKNINDLKKEINFYKIDYNNLLQNNLNYQKHIAELKNLLSQNSNLIIDYKNNIDCMKIEIENLNKKNIKFKNLNQLLNEKNKILNKDILLNRSDNEYLEQSNKRLKERIYNK